MILAGFLRKHNDPQLEYRLKSVFQKEVKNLLFSLNEAQLTLYCGMSSDNDFDQVFMQQNLVIIGRVFSKLNFNELTEVDFIYRKDPIDYLKNDCWGKYIAINFNHQERVTTIVRDTLGQLDFYYRILPKGNILFSSQIDLLYKLLDEKPCISENFIKSYLLYGNDFVSKNSAFEKISELPPGYQLNFKNNDVEIKEFYDPFSLSIDSYNQDWSEEKLGNALEKTLQSWIKPYKNVFISLSGGLDSSSITYSLSETSKQTHAIKAINLFHPKVAASDERKYAKKVCQQAGVELIEVDLSEKLPFGVNSFTRFKSHTPQPTVLLPYFNTLSEIINTTPASLLINGNGGDHLFMYPLTKFILADHFIDYKFKNFYTALCEMAFYCREPFYTLLKENIPAILKYYLNIKPMKTYCFKEKIASWLSKDIVNFNHKVDFHPIFSNNLFNVRPGKLEQIQNFYRAIPTLYLDHADLCNPTFYPLMQQPIAELAFQIPTYKLFQKGYDRYVFRKAVSDRYKVDSVWRRDKGESSGVYQLSVKKHLKEIQAICCEGYLAKNQWFDKDHFNKELLQIASGENKDMWPLIFLITLEIFCSSWKTA